MKTLVVGLGNPILGDDGVGIRVAQILQDRINRPDVTIAETSIAGLDFLDLLIGYDRAIIIDAIQTREGKAGQIYKLDPGQLAVTRHTSSLHDISFNDALELGKKLELDLPSTITVFGIEIKDVVNLGEQFTAEVEQAIPSCVELVSRELA